MCKKLFFNEFYNMLVHIGKVIKRLVKEKGFTVTEFAEKINYSRRNVYEIFDKNTIDTGLLVKIGKLLNENLFLNYISETDIYKYKSNKTTKEEMEEILLLLKTEVKKLKEISAVKHKK